MSGINVLSLFDGMSCGMIALERAGIKVNKYFASEIDKHAIKVSNHNYPNIIRIGDVTKVSYKDGVLYWDGGSAEVEIDLLIGGSPCQSFSNLGDGSGFDGKSGLYYHFLRILSEVKPKNWMLENVVMKNNWRDIITSDLGISPVKICSSLVSAQNRNRYYWTNIKFDIPKDKGITIQDVLEKDVNEKYYLSDKAKVYILNRERLLKKYTDLVQYKSVCLPARYTALNGSFVCLDVSGKFSAEKAGTLTQRYAKGVSNFGGDSFPIDLEVGDIRRFTPTECERLQTVPDGYTICVSDTQRYRMLGNGWTVDVIAHIFKGLK